MIDFKLTEEQLALQQTARKFAQTEMAPNAAHHDQTGEFPRSIIENAWKVGLLNESIPAEYGGLGLDGVSACILTEELAAGCAGMTTSMMVNTLGQTPVLVAGTQAQIEKWIVPFTQEFKFAAFCLTEPSSGSDVASMHTTAKKVGDKYVLNGRKCFITNGGVADVFTVFATLDPAKSHRGICAFVVSADTPGVSAGKKEDKMGQRASNTTDVIFEEAAIPEENLLGAEGGGFKIAMKTLDRTRPAIGALAVGLARSAYEHSVKYAKERNAFGMPIAMFQAIQFMLADMAKDIEAPRLLTWQSAWMVDQGMNASKYSSFAKCFSTDAAMRITTDAVQIYGGYGYSKEYPVEKLMRDAKLLQIYEGTNQIQRMVIAREIFKES
ncbi:MAG: acyl-CoA dehydrogenase [Deltaproteobacteria bacterium RBG_13_65_10]|nr:MAG: acyl-CoA dehydrogenase [Deltaproteobacteria bacterium RBG_13_65_10]